MCEPSALSETKLKLFRTQCVNIAEGLVEAVVSLIGKSCDQIQMLVDISKAVDLFYNPFSFSKSMVLRMALMV